MPIHQPNRPRGIAVIIWMTAALFIYAIMLLITLPKLQEMSGGVYVFDMMPSGYDSQYAHDLLAELGTEGRQFYLWRQIPLDLIYPALFGISFYLLASWLAIKLNAFQGILRLTAWVAVAAGVFDYIENMFIILMLRYYPELSEPLVGAASIATVFKSFFTMIYFTIVVALLIGRAFYFILRQRSLDH